MKKKYRVIADNSWHNLPIGAIVEPTEAPSFFPDDDDARWYTQGGDGDEACIDDSDLEEVTDA